MGKITAHGGDALIGGEEKFDNLTGSAYVYEINGKKILVDLGMFQGIEGADFFNKDNNNFLKGIDVVLITHPHIDHIGRLPLLNQAGFEGDIYMSSAAKEITYEMLVDSLKIQEEEIIEKVRINKHLGKRLRKALKIKTFLEDLSTNKLSGEEINIRKTYLGKVVGKEYDSEKTHKEVSSYLELYNVKEEKDIEEALSKLREKMFSMEDVLEVLKKIKTIDIGEETILYSKEKKNELDQSEIELENLPKLVKEGFKKLVGVGTRSKKREIRKLWQDKLKQNIENVKKSGINLSKERDELKKELQKRLIYLETYKFLDESNQRDINTIHFENKEEYKEIRKNIKEYKEFLKKYQITDEKSIERLIGDDEKLIDLLNIELEFSSKDIEEASRLLEIREVETTREIIGISAVDAAHVVGSVSYQIASGETKSKVNKIMNLDKVTETVFLSGDLGRMNDNRIGTPDIPKYGTDFLQIESTYGGKEHLEKQKAVENLINEIESTKGKVLISTFSQQRNQEILMVLLEYLLGKGSDALNYEILIDAPLAERLSNIYINYYGEQFNLLKSGVQEKIFGKVIFRYLGEGEYEEVYSTKEENYTLDNLLNFDYNNKKIDHISKGKKEELKYHIDELITTNLRGDHRNNIKNIINILGIDLYQEFFGEIYFNNKKTIILASSGMMDGGAIMNHLPHILSDKDNKLLAPGYLSENTIGNQIVIQKSKYVTINGSKIKIECDSKYLDGFSSHISHSEIIEYITKCIEGNKLNKKSTINITHGSEKGQNILKEDILKLLEKFDRTDITVRISEMGEDYYIKEKKSVQKGNKGIIIPKKDKKEVPHYLLDGDKQLSKKENKEIEDETSKLIEEIYSFSQKNEKEINELLKVINQKLENIKNYSYAKAIEKTTKKLKKDKSLLERKFNLLNWKQKKQIDESIDLKLARNKELENIISDLSRNGINELKDLIEKVNNFIYIYNRNFQNEIEKRGNIITELEEEKSEINNKIYAEKNGKNDKGRIDKLKRDLKEINKKIKNEEKNITSIEKHIISFKADCRRIINKYISKDDALTILQILDELWENNEVFDRFRNKINTGISRLGSKISVLKSELESNITINLSKSEENFDGINLFEILYPNESQKINIELIKEYINDGYIDNKDIDFIQKNLFIIENSNSKIERTKAGKAIRKFFKDKSKENEELGIDLELKIGELENYYLNKFKELFEKDYYESYILPTFNIYLFIKSKNSIIDYIFQKYDYKKLKSYGEEINNHEYFIEEFEYYEKLLNKINNGNNVELVEDYDKEEIIKKKEKLNDISYGIEETKIYIEKLLELTK